MNTLIDKSELRTIQAYKGMFPFNYDLCVDWAIELLQQGVVTDSIQMLASFQNQQTHGK